MNFCPLIFHVRVKILLSAVFFLPFFFFSFYLFLDEEFRLSDEGNVTMYVHTSMERVPPLASSRC